MYNLPKQSSVDKTPGRAAVQRSHTRHSHIFVPIAGPSVQLQRLRACNDARRGRFIRSRRAGCMHTRTDALTVQ